MGGLDQLVHREKLSTVPGTVITWNERYHFYCYSQGFMAGQWLRMDHVQRALIQDPWL